LQQLVARQAAKLAAEAPKLWLLPNLAARVYLCMVARPVDLSQQCLHSAVRVQCESGVAVCSALILPAAAHLQVCTHQFANVFVVL
jgi:hypothetical protein